MKLEKDIYRLKIEIAGAEREISRTVEIEKATTLHELHNIIQELFLWDDSHLHEFFWKKNHEIENELEKEIHIEELLKRKGDKIIYLYDFGDSWEHVINLEKIVEKNPNVEFYPNLISAKRRAPDEDSGGIYGWEDICYVLGNRDVENGMYEEYIEWMTEGDEENLDFYTITEDDIRDIARRLKRFAKVSSNLKSLETKNTKSIVKLLKKENFTPDLRIIREILKRDDAEEILLSELELLLSRTKPTIQKNGDYLLNLMVLLTELESKKLPPLAMKLLEFKEEFWEKMFGAIVPYLSSIYSRLGDDYTSFLCESLKDEKTPFVICSSLIEIYKRGGKKDKKIEKAILELVERESGIPELDLMKLIAILYEGFSPVESILVKRSVEINLRMGNPIPEDTVLKKLDGLTKLQNCKTSPESINIDEFYSELKKFDGDKSYNPNMLGSLGDLTMGEDDYEFSEDWEDEAERFYLAQEKLAETKISPNQFCPCGSGKKYKKCCG